MHGKKETSTEKSPPLEWPVGIYSGHFLYCKLMQEGQAHCGQGSLRQVGLGSIGKVTKQARKQHSSMVSASSHTFSSCPGFP